MLFKSNVDALLKLYKKCLYKPHKLQALSDENYSDEEAFANLYKF